MRARMSAIVMCSSYCRARRGNSGGEGSGHIICIDKHTTGDGIISALQVLHALRDSAGTLADFAQSVTLFPQKLINIKVPKGFDSRSSVEIKAVQAEAERDLDTSGRVLLRPSGTEPLLRIMVEGENQQKVKYWAEKIADVAREAAELNKKVSEQAMSHP